MSKRDDSVTRPINASEYTIKYATASARKGWSDVCATQRNSAADAWERLTKDPTSMDGTCHPLKGKLSAVTRDGEEHAQWQYELTGGARIWFYVSGRSVYLIAIHTHHSNATK